MEESRKIKFEKEDNDKLIGSGVGGEKKEKRKVDGNPRLVLTFFLVSVGVTLGVWLVRSGREVVMKLTSPKVYQTVTVGEKEEVEGKKVDMEGAKAEIEELLATLRGEYAVYVYDFESKKEVLINATRKQEAASLMKLPVLMVLYRKAEAGEVDLETKYTLKEGDKIGGAGSMAYASAGSVYSYRKMAELMGQQSDNTAYGVVVKNLGRDNIAEMMKELDLPDTVFSENLTTAVDMGRLFRGLYTGKYLSRKGSEEIMGYLTKTIYENRIPTGVPTGVRVAHKVGTEVGVVSDAGVIMGKYPFVLVVMSQKAALAEGEKAIADIGRIVWGYVEER